MDPVVLAPSKFLYNLVVFRVYVSLQWGKCQDFMKALGFEEQGEILQLPEGVSLKRIDALLRLVL